MSGRITGRIEVLLNGKMLLNKAGAVAKGIGISGAPNYELAPVIGDGGHHGFTETPIMAGCDVTITDRDDISLSEIARIRENGTVIFRTAGGGKAYIMNNATCLRNIEITGGEGETPLRFAGAYWTETVQ